MLRFFSPANRVVLISSKWKCQVITKHDFLSYHKQLASWYCNFADNDQQVIVPPTVSRACCLWNSLLVQVRFYATPILFSIIKSFEKSLLLFQLKLHLLPNQFISLVNYTCIKPDNNFRTCCVSHGKDRSFFGAISARARKNCLEDHNMMMACATLSGKINLTTHIVTFGPVICISRT